MKIHVHNVVDGERLTYHLALLIGEIECSMLDGEVEVWNNKGDTNRLKWLVIEGCFKVLVKLELGENIVHISYNAEELLLKLILENPNFCHFVRPVYIVCEDDDGTFQGPTEEDCSVESALQRIALAAQLIQTFTAEKMREHGFGRQTFQLETGEETYTPLCHLFRSKLRVEEASKMTGNQLWTYFGKELMMSDFSNKDSCKWYCFMSFTRYNPPAGDIPKTHSEIISYTTGYTALGGGGLALFGSGNLHTWAENLDEVHARFTDSRKIDRTKFMDDSAYREYYWANYATGLGASLHELGHTFDLAHTKTGIMARGFDDINKVFTVQRSQNTNLDKEGQVYNRHSIPRALSLGELGEPPMESHARQYRDACYGSPFKKMTQSTNGTAHGFPPPLMVKVETDFRLVPSQSSLMVLMKNYDGTETHQTITQEEGQETVTEVTLSHDGKMLSKNNRTERRASTSSASSTSSQSLTAASTKPFMLPNSPDEADLSFPTVLFADGGAHWYRSSAVLLRFHKWFNKYDPQDSGKAPVISGCCIKSQVGLRLVELRTEPEGQVFYHWEFLQDNLPTLLELRSSRIKHLPQDAKLISILAEDNYGNISKKKIKVVDIESLAQLLKSILVEGIHLPVSTER